MAGTNVSSLLPPPPLRAAESREAGRSTPAVEPNRQGGVLQGGRAWARPSPGFQPRPLPTSAPPPTRRGCLLRAASSGRLSPRGTPLPRRRRPLRARSPFPAPAPLSAASAPHRLARRVPVSAAALPGSPGRDHGGGRGRRADETATHAGKERGGRGPQTKAAARRGLAGASGGWRRPPRAAAGLCVARGVAGGDRPGAPQRTALPRTRVPAGRLAASRCRPPSSPAAWTPPSSGPGGCSSCGSLRPDCRYQRSVECWVSGPGEGPCARSSPGPHSKREDRVTSPADPAFPVT